MSALVVILIRIYEAVQQIPFVKDTNYTVSQKHPDIFSCNLNKHILISIIFGTNIT